MIKGCCRGIAILLFILFSAGISYAATLLSGKAKISLLTIYPGEELFSAFGHSAFWIYDPNSQTDIVYSYGTYDFEQPNFYLNFVRGHLNYMLSTYSMEEQYYSAKYEGRKIVCQELGLDSGLAQQLCNYLEWNALGQNRYYLYDFYLDNCSTRLRDVLLKVAGRQVTFDSTLQSSLSFRQWMNHFLGNHPVSALGMNIGLGAPADRKTDYLTQMYLPLNLMQAFSNAKLLGDPLVSRETVILDSPTHNQEQGHALLFSVLTILILAILLTLLKKAPKAILLLFDTFLFLFPFLLGLVLTLLWAATDHWVCAWNTDLLWANPFSCFYLVLLFSPNRSSWLSKVIYCTIGLSLAYMTLGYLLPEKPILILFPLILAIQIRIIHRLTTKPSIKPSL